MERKLPKNIRQIGNVSDNPKVYVEDYVDTFFNQMCEKASEVPVGAFLIGETFRKDEQDYIFIHGVVQMQGLEQKGTEVTIGDKTWKKACEEGKRYFAGNTILGWILIAPGLQLKLNQNLIKLHERLFMKKSRMFIMKDSIEKEESFFVYKYNDLMQIGGHYIYYEKNPAMQDYMIANRKQNCVTPSEVFEDRATKNFRSIINKKEEEEKQRWRNRHSYMASAMLMLLVVAIGVTGLNRYDKLEAVQNSVTNALSSVLRVVGVGEEVEEVESDLITTDVGGESEQKQVNEEFESEIYSEGESETEVLNEGVEDEQAQGDEDVDGETVEDIEESVDEEVVNVEKSEEVSQVVTRTEYVVEDGDTLARISINVYGTMAKADEISEYNNLDDVDYIYVGQVLQLP